MENSFADAAKLAFGLIFATIIVGGVIWFLIRYNRKEVLQMERVRRKKVYLQRQQELLQLLKGEEKRKKDEEIWQKRVCDLRAGDGYRLIERFLDRFKPDAETKEFIQLADVLRYGGDHFSNEEILRLLTEEQKRRVVKQSLSSLLKAKVKTRQDLLKVYLDLFSQSTAETFEALEQALADRGFAEETTEDLHVELRMLRREIELTTFRNNLLREEGRSKSIKATDSLSGYEFEKYLAELFVRMGYDVQHTKQSGDQGADLILARYDELTLVQAKRAQSRIGNKAVQEIVAALRFYKGSKGMVVTNNFFTAAAQKLADANDIELVDREELAKWAEGYL